MPEIGVMFWADEPLDPLLSLGFTRGQLGIPGDFDLHTGNRRHAIKLYTVFAAFTGEDYADVPTVERTVGFVPQATRAERERRMLSVSDFARDLGVNSIATHIGCIKPGDMEMRDLVRGICDHAAGNRQTFALETGQEPARELLEFIHAVDRPNLGINFDPANMILYGSGDPIEALGILKDHLLSVHCKDGNWPERAGALGAEQPLGQGAVNIPRFVQELNALGYSGPLFIERESSDRPRRLKDLEAAAQLLSGL